MTEVLILWCPQYYSRILLLILIYLPRYFFDMKMPNKEQIFLTKFETQILDILPIKRKKDISILTIQP